MHDKILSSRWAIVSGFAIALMAGAFFGAFTSSSFQGSGKAESAATPTAVSSRDLAEDRLTFAPAVKAALPAVVNIAADKLVEAPSGMSPLFQDPLFREFFGFGDRFPGPRERREHSLGSGVIVSAEGYILTNNHVVDGAEEIKVFLSDKRELSAEIVGTDPRTDLAVLKADSDALPTLAFGSSASVEVGDIALAIGNPFGVGQTVTMGIVSAVARGNLGIVDYEDFIQTDASINPGNSGGALVDVEGNLIGINTAIISRGAQGNQGIGFAIPIDMAREVMDQIIDHGRVVRGWLGVSIQEVTPELAKAFDLEQGAGALVSEVVADSPAERAGFDAGDVIVRIDGEPVEDVRALRLKIAATLPDSNVRLTVVRDGEEKEIVATLGTLPDELSRAPVSSERSTGFLSDVQVRDLDPEIRRQLGLGDDVEGVVVTSVTPGGPSEEAGLLRGDVILSINRQPVFSVDRFRELTASVAGDSILVRVQRRGSGLFLVIERD